MSFTRTLIFKTDKSTITQPVTLMLTFDQIQSNPSMSQVAWRVLEFGGGNEQAIATYIQDLMVCSLQVSSGNIVIASSSQELGLGQQTTLVKSGGGVMFTPPVNGIQGELTAINNTGDFQGIGVGFLDAAGNPNPLLVWEQVGNTSSVEAQFTPVLSAYVTAQYQQTEIIRGEIVSPVLLQKNLATLTDTQEYTLSMAPGGAFVLTPGK